MKSLIIGPRYKNINQTGGIVVLFENWLEYCHEKNIQTDVIDTNKSNYCNIIVAYLSILFDIVRKSRSVSYIFLHGTIKDYLLIAPVAIFVGKIFHKKVFLRKFAGSFDQCYDNVGKFKKNIFDYVLKNADILFWETKSLVKFGKQINNESYWFPNVRVKSDIYREHEIQDGRFVFLSQVRKEKGINILKDAFLGFTNIIHIDIYGPVIEYKDEELSGFNYTYRGCVSPSDVCKILSKYDALILPTYCKTEGYPGIIIEAYSVGIPVIATRIGGIPEIVKDGYNGYLIEPHSADSLMEAIRRFENDDYAQLSQNALKSFENFDASVVNNRIHRIIRNK